MRIAAGVLLILVSLGNGCLGAGVTILGGATAVVGEGVNEYANAAEGSGLDAAQAAEARAAGEAVTQVGGMLALLGVGLLVLFGLQLAAAICLFVSKAAKFIMVVGGLGIIVPLLFHFSAEPENQNLIITLVAVAISALAIFAAVQMDKQAGPGAMAPRA